MTTRPYSPTQRIENGQQLHLTASSPKSSPDSRGEPCGELRKPTDRRLEPLTYSAEACQACRLLATGSGSLITTSKRTLSDGWAVLMELWGSRPSSYCRPPYLRILTFCPSLPLLTPSSLASSLVPVTPHPLACGPLLPKAPSPVVPKPTLYSSIPTSPLLVQGLPAIQGPCACQIWLSCGRRAGSGAS